MTKVAVAMSGGVDSSAAAALLLEQGYQVFGVSLHMWQEGQDISSKSETVEAARQVAVQLGIPFEAVNVRDQFHARVVQPFVQGYLGGITPSPCVGCNRTVKWSAMLAYADREGIDLVATGHYARLMIDEIGAVHLLQGIDKKKDQAYMLAFLGQKELSRTLLPIGSYQKAEIREVARRYGLEAADRSDSQDLCFLPEGNYRRFVRENAEVDILPGKIVTTDGEVLGEHQGLPYYTIGQRKGLGISTPRPMYVLKKDIAKNQLIVAEKQALGRIRFTTGQMKWVLGSPPKETFRAQVKIRYRAKLVWGQFDVLADGRVRGKLEEPQFDITPGQVAVYYQGNEVLGGGIILRLES